MHCSVTFKSNFSKCCAQAFVIPNRSGAGARCAIRIAAWYDTEGLQGKVLIK